MLVAATESVVAAMSSLRGDSDFQRLMVVPMVHRLLSFPGFYRVVIALLVLGPASILRAQPYAAPSVTGVSAETTNFVFAYDEAGRLIGMADAAGNTATYTYDAVGNILSIARGSAAVSILAFSPKSGPVGTNVTILGAGFSATAAQNAVTFNGAPAAVVTAAPNQLVVVVPGAATTGPIRVTSPTGSAVTATSFTVGPNNAPSISGFTPTIGTVGSTVTITGTNFEPAAGNNRVSFNGNLGVASSATATSLGVVVSSTTTSGPITVSTPNGRATSTGDFFVSPSPYTAADVAVTGRMAIGETRSLTVSQANKIGLVAFSGSAGQRISLGVGLDSGFYYCPSMSIRRPDGPYLVDSTFVCTGFIDRQVLPVSGTYLITFDPSLTETGTATLTLYNVPPDATAGIVPGGSPVTVTTATPGQNLAVTFAGSAGQRISLGISVGTVGGSCGYLSILRPDGSALVGAAIQCASGFIDLQVLPVSGTYRITFDPYGAATGAVTLTLYNVPPDATAGIVPGGPPVTVTTTIPGQNAVLTFAGSAGQRISLDISVGIAGGDCGYFSILQPDGSEFFRFVECATGFIDLPALPVSGTYRIVFDPMGTATGTATLTLHAAPIVISISPRSGTTHGGTPIVITGGDFQSGATVSIGDVPATVVSVAGNTIKATTGAHATGTVSVSVTNPDNRSGTLSDSYFYDPPSEALSFYTVIPCRLVDTRNPNAPLGGPSLGAGTLRVFTAIGSCGIPAGAKSLSVNITVPAPTVSGFLSLYPGNAIPMGTSSLNFSAGQTRANNALIKLSTDGLGTLAVQNGASGNVDVIVDVNGYFL
ncbi:MAG: IPT/TIG domain-containing protein [Acidobacteriota bacterium]